MPFKMLSQLPSDQPYTTAEEDPFSVQPYIHPTKVQRKRSSMVDKWINEQQGHPSEDYLSSASVPPTPAYFEDSSVCGSRGDPYMAYPDLPRVSSERTRPNEQDNESIISYDLIDDDDIPNDPIPLPEEVPKEPTVTTIVPQRSHKSSRNSITPSFRNLTLSFRSQATTQGELPSHTNMETPPRVFTRLSFFPRTPRSSTGPQAVSSSLTSTPQPTHSKSSSLPTLDFSATPSPSHRISPSSSTSKWRPSVLGHFQHSSMSEVSVNTSEPQYAPSRPSISSADTYSTWHTSQTTTTVDSNVPSTPSKVSLLESIRLRGTKSPATRLKGFSRSTLSLRSSAQQSSEILDSQPKGKDILQQRSAFAPKPGSYLDNIDDEDDLDDPPTYRFNQHPRNPVPRSVNGTLSRVKFSSLNARARKKKKLLVTGVGVTETRKFEGVKRWCESFGDIRQITRLPNGDLEFDFRDPEVADTVCRVRAKVHIAGVGSVQLSWVAGNKR